MNLEDGICTLNEEKNWINFLSKQSKEELVKLLVDKMIRDESFYREIVLKLIKSKSDINELIHYYVQEVEFEMNQETPNVDFLSTLSETMLDIGQNKSYIEKIYIETSVIQSLNDALCNGAGYANQDEFVLDEIMNRCGEQMLDDTTKYINNLPESEVQYMHHYMRDKAVGFTSYASKNYFRIVEEKFFKK